MTVDQRTGTLFTDRSYDGHDVWVFDGATCNAVTMTGCSEPALDVPVGGWPGDLTVNPSTSTLYVPDETDGQISLFGYARGTVYP